MIVKMEKGESNVFMLLDVAVQATISKVTTGIDTWNYLVEKNKQIATPIIKDEAKPEEVSACRVLQILGVEYETPMLFMTEPYRVPQIDTEPRNTSVKCVNVDGVAYLTNGRVFILNNDGKTIQRV